jgi:TonB family protein
MPSEAYPSEGQRTKSDKVFSGLNDEEWYWLKSAIVRLVLYRQTPPGTRDINNSSFVLSACSFVGVSVYGSAMAESNQPQRTVNPAVTKAVAIREVQPVYTSDAKRAKVQGSVWLEVTVMPDGTVGDVKVVRSLDPIFGLDQAAIEAAKQWRFRPGMRGNQPTESKLTIELTFTLR